MNKRNLIFKLISIFLMVLMVAFISCSSDSSDEDLKKEIKKEIILKAILNGAAENKNETVQTETAEYGTYETEPFEKYETAESLVGTTWSTPYGRSFSFYENGKVTEAYPETTHRDTDTGEEIVETKTRDGTYDDQRILLPYQNGDGTFYDAVYTWFVYYDYDYDEKNWIYTMNIYPATNPYGAFAVYKN